jgi:hypothetical protein
MSNLDNKLPFLDKIFTTDNFDEVHKVYSSFLSLNIIQDSPLLISYKYLVTSNHFNNIFYHYQKVASSFKKLHKEAVEESTIIAFLPTSIFYSNGNNQVSLSCLLCVHNTNGHITVNGTCIHLCTGDYFWYLSGICIVKIVGNDGVYIFDNYKLPSSTVLDHDILIEPVRTINVNGKVNTFQLKKESLFYIERNIKIPIGLNIDRIFLLKSDSLYKSLLSCFEENDDFAKQILQMCSTSVLLLDICYEGGQTYERFVCENTSNGYQKIFFNLFICTADDGGLILLNNSVICGQNGSLFNFEANQRCGVSKVKKGFIILATLIVSYRV